MKPNRNRYLLLNYIFITSLIILFVNDQILKFSFSNWWTGKLSDMAGMVILPLLIAYLLPKLKLWATFISAVLFFFWKSPLSEPLIGFYNTYSFIETSRIVDYSDLIVLSLLPFSHFLIIHIDVWTYLKIEKVNPVFILLPTVAALMATSPPQSFHYTRTEGNLRCYNCHMTVDYSQAEIVEQLKKNEIVFDHVSIVDSYSLKRVPDLAKENAHYYKINELIIDRDTLRNLDFTMRTFTNGKTIIHFNGLQVSDEVSDWKLAGKLSRYYRKILFKELKTNLKH